MHGLTTYTATYEGAEYVKEAKIFLIHPPPPNQILVGTALC